jgi:hypothetical protein
MRTTTNNYKSAIKAPTRTIAAKVELYGSALEATYTKNDIIKSISIERVAEDSKFFGFGVTHKVNIHLIDVNRTINPTTSNYFKIYLGVKVDGEIEYIPFPKFYVTEVNRDENTNELSITAYDKLKDATALTVDDLSVSAPYTIKTFVEGCGAALELPVVIPDSIEVFNTEYETGANFEGTEKIQEALVAAAEATQTIFYIDGNDNLIFKRLDRDGSAVKTISKEEYVTLRCSTNRRLQTIASVTELGDNVSNSTSQIGTTQYIRDNAFLTLREDIATLIDNAVAEIGNITINQVECSWRGDMSLEVGDKVNFITKDNDIATSYLLNDSITYEGGLEESTEWNYNDSGETDTNPTSLGETLKKTYAKVDKANKQVDIVVSEVEASKETITNLQLNTESINASVQKIETVTNETLDSINTELDTLTQKVETAVTAEAVEIAIKSELANGVSKVETTTGYRLDEDGLTISKTGSEMVTNIDDNGMSVYRNDEEVLTANNEGVTAYNLHAKTYLIIGSTSRFEDYEKDGEIRTGCFWIGGGN